jgi:small-conductance mechanosensitive channel
MRRSLEALQQIIVHDPMKIVVPLLIFGVTFFAGWLVRRMVLRGLRTWNTRNHNRVWQILHEALGGPMLIWSLMLAVHFAMESSAIPKQYTALGSNVLIVLWVLSLTLMLMQLANDIVRYYGSQIPGALPVTTLTQTLAQAGVLVLGIATLLYHFNLSVAPVLTALGVGGLAVALALQDTLSNLFSGFYVALARQVRVGDYIKLNTGEEGYVTDIGWRSTTIRALANNLIIVPNSKLAQAIVTNYNMPEKRMGASFVVTVGYDCDLDQIEKLLGEVLQASTGDVPGLLAEPAPSLAFDPGFADNGVGLTVNYQVAEFVNQFGVRNELKKRIYRRFREEGVAIPYPARTVYLRGDRPRPAPEALPEKGLQPDGRNHHQ